MLRWRHPEQGLLGPDEFLGVAERVFMLPSISNWALDEALGQVVLWRPTGWADARVALNLATGELRHAPLAQRVRDALVRHGLSGESLELEVTETLLLEDESALLATLAELRGLGAEITIDDFGTGYSALARRRTLPVDRIKIDRSFIEPMLSDPGASRLVASMLHLARSLDLKSTAEGVEQGAQLKALRELGCDEVQGFLFSPPLPAADFLARLPAWLSPPPSADARNQA